jgi:hypothetical protein
MRYPESCCEFCRRETWSFEDPAEIRECDGCDADTCEECAVYEGESELALCPGCRA